VSVCLFERIIRSGTERPFPAIPGPFESLRVKDRAGQHGFWFAETLGLRTKTKNAEKNQKLESLFFQLFHMFLTQNLLKLPNLQKFPGLVVPFKSYGFSKSWSFGQMVPLKLETFSRDKTYDVYMTFISEFDADHEFTEKFGFDGSVCEL
jgi:hypothetical protein